MKAFYIIILTTLSITLLAQDNCDFIPKDLDESFMYINCKWSKSDIKKFKKTQEKKAVENSINWMNWELVTWEVWKGEEEIGRYFFDFGIGNTEDMAFIILTSYHRHLRARELKLDEQVEYIKKYRTDLNQKEYNKKVISINKFMVNDTVIYYSGNFISEKQKENYFNKSCFAKGIVLEKNPNTLKLKIRLIESCDLEGIIIERYTHSRIDNSWVEKEILVIMKQDEIKWTPFEIWSK